MNHPNLNQQLWVQAELAYDRWHATPGIDTSRKTWISGYVSAMKDQQRSAVETSAPLSEADDGDD